MDIKISSTSTQTVTRKAHDITIDGEKYVYIEMLNEKGELIDAELRDAEGYPVDDADLFEEVQNFFDSVE